jgi:tRNA (guanine-N7-)-methyltransferase
VIQEKKIRSFVNRKGRKLSDNKIKLLADAKKNKILLTDNDFNEIEKIAKNYKEVCFEIGFGSGEHISHIAQIYPERLFIGCEPFELGVTKLLAKIKTEKINNILIYNNDALDLLKSLPDNFINKLYVLYPDPWPKKRHNKRRIINNENLQLFANKMTDKSKLLIATDHNDYASWIIAHLINNKNFKWLINNVEEVFTEPNEWSKTKYQKKSLDNKDKHYFYNFSKI